ncbi:MAG: aminotransferase class IV family protein [Planctomycetes bacterium]|nr:aminotransferase class IV family protein [Planctomycetota bacterium]
MHCRMLVWLNGKFIERDTAVVSAFDAGLQHGIGLFETMVAYHGKIFRAHAHVQRLVESARLLLLTESLHAEPLADAVHMVVKRNGLESARVRLTVTGGNLNLLQSRGRSKVDPTILIEAGPPTMYPEAFFEQGVVVTIADGRLNPLDPMAGHKTLNYWPRILALQHATAKKASEALWFALSNHLVGGSVSNVFLVTDGVLHTPIARGEELEDSTRSPVLPGITRAAIIALADSLDVHTDTRTIDIDDLLGADEVFLTNSSWGVLPVVGVEREKIGNGEVGEMTQRLRDGWLALVERETAG